MHSQGLRTNCLVLCAEPVGAKAPTFASDMKVLSFVRHSGLGFGLLCQAQGHLGKQATVFKIINFNIQPFCELYGCEMWSLL
jgi:hypothetical protein